MKILNRAVIRGKPLESLCYRAKTLRNYNGKNDNRILCYGMAEDLEEDIVCECCKECKAFVRNEMDEEWFRFVEKNRKERL